MPERMLPQNVEAERGVLGSIILDPEVLPLVLEKLLPEDFYQDAHRLIYEAILRVNERREPADTITIADELKRHEQLETIGGESGLWELMESIPTSGNVEYYARLVARTAVLRRLIHAAGKVAALAYEELEDAEQAIERAEQALFAVSQRLHGQDNLHFIEEIAAEYIDDLDKFQRKTGLTGIPTGFRDLDQALGGMQKSDLLILAARPGQGKTSMALNMVHHAVYQQQTRVLLFSLEMSRKQLVQRLFSMETGIDQQRLRLGWLDDADWEPIVLAGDRLSEGKLWIDDTGAITIEALRSRARRLKAQSGLDLIVVDYLQLIDGTVNGTQRQQSREREIARISSSLKALAKELDVPVLALAQLSRAVEYRASKVPQLSDLRESGAIENDADVVMFIHRDEQASEQGAASGEAQTADLTIAKHRNGPVGYIRLAWHAGQTTFRDLQASSKSA